MPQSSGNEFSLGIVIEATTGAAQKAIDDVTKRVEGFGAASAAAFKKATDASTSFVSGVAGGTGAATKNILQMAASVTILGKAFTALQGVYSFFTEDDIGKGLFESLQAEADAFIADQGAKASIADILFAGLELAPDRFKTAITAVKADIYSLQDPLEELDKIVDGVAESLNWEAKLAGASPEDSAKIQKAATQELQQLKERSTELLVSLREGLGDVGVAASEDIGRVIEQLQSSLISGALSPDAGFNPKQQAKAVREIAEEMANLRKEAQSVAAGLGEGFESSLKGSFERSRVRLEAALSGKGLALPNYAASFDQAGESASQFIANIRADVTSLNDSFSASFKLAIGRSKTALSGLFGGLKLDTGEFDKIGERIGDAIDQAASKSEQLALTIAGNISRSEPWVGFTEKAEAAIGQVAQTLKDRLSDLPLGDEVLASINDLADLEFGVIADKAVELRDEIRKSTSDMTKSTVGSLLDYMNETELQLRNLFTRVGALAQQRKVAESLSEEFDKLRALAEEALYGAVDNLAPKVSQAISEAKNNIEKKLKQEPPKVEVVQGELVTEKPKPLPALEGVKSPTQKALPPAVDREMGQSFAELDARSQKLLTALTARYTSASNEVAGILEGYIEDAKTSFGDYFRIQEELGSAAERPALPPGKEGGGLAVNEAAKQSALDSLDELSEAIGATNVELNSTLSNPAPWLKFAANAAGAADKVFTATNATIDGFSKINAGVVKVGGIVSNFGGALLGLDEPMQVFNRAKDAIGGLSAGVGSIVQEIGFFSNGLDAVKQLATAGPFQMLIGQNVELRQQLLSTQASLVSTNKVIRNGVVLNDQNAIRKLDPKAGREAQKEAITALQGPVEAAIKSLRQKSIDLVGVTSKDLIPVFQIISRYSTQLGLSMEQVSELTASTAAGMGTMGVPLFQAQQEITSILSGTIDMNSVMAKNLGITNEMVAKWKSQGRVYEELNARLSAFRAGNELMAQTIEGVSSNIQEMVDEVGRAAGEQLLGPVTEQLTKVYEYLKKNRDGITVYATEVVGIIMSGVQELLAALGVAFNASDDIFASLPKLLAGTLSALLKSVANVIKTLTPIIQPFLDLMATMAKNAQVLGPLFAQIFIGGKAVQFAVKGMSEGFGTFASMLPGLGELLFFVNLRNNEMLNGFLGMKKSVGPGVAGLFSLAKGLNGIPGGAAAATKAIAKFSPLLGTMAPGIVSILPALGSFGTMMVGMSAKNEMVGATFENLVGKLPALSKNATELVEKFAPLIDDIVPGLSTQLKVATGAIGTYSTGQQIAEATTAATTKIMKEQIRTQTLMLAKLVVVVAVILLVVHAFKKFVLENKALMEMISAVGMGLGIMGKALTDMASNPIALAIIAVGGLSTALYILAQSAGVTAVSGIWKLILAQGALIAKSAVGAVIALGTALINMGLVSGAGAAAIGTLSASAAAGTVTFGAFATTVALALGPLLLLVAAVGVLAVALAANAIGEANESLDIYAKTTNAVAQSSLEMEARIRKNQKATADKTKNGIALSKEEYAENKKIRELTMLEMKGLESQIGDLKAAEGDMKTDEQKANLKGQIAELEERRSKLKGLIDTVQIAAQELPRSGTAFEQYTSQVSTALLALEKPSGEMDKFNDQAKKLLEGTDALLEAERITVAEAVANYEKLANNEFVDKETQLTAQKGITAALKKEQEKRLEDVKTVEAETQSLLDAGRMGEAKAGKMLGEAKKAELDQQLAYLIEIKAKEDEIRKASIDKEREELDKKMKVASEALVKASLGNNADAIKSAQAEVDDLSKKKSALDGQAKTQQSEADRKFNNEKKKTEAEIKAQEEKNLKQAYESKQKFIQAGQDLEQAALDRGLQSQAEFAKDSLGLSQQKATAEIAEIQRQKKLLDPSDKDGLKQLEAKESQARAGQIKAQQEYYEKLLEIKTKALEADQKIAEAALAKGDITDSAFAEQSLELSRDRLDAEAANVQEQIKLAGKNVEKRHELQGQLADIDKRRIEALQAYHKKVLEIRMQVNQAEESILKAQVARGKVSELDGLDGSKKLADERFKLQEGAIREELKLAGKNVEKRKILEGQLADIESQRVESATQYRQKRLEILTGMITAEESILKAQLKSGGVSEKAAIGKTQELSNQRLDLQAAALEEELKLAGNNVQKRKAIQGQLAEIDVKRYEAAEKAADDRIALVEREEAKAQSVLEESIAQRELQVERFRQANPWKQEEAATLDAQANLKKIQGEYQQTIAVRRRLEAVSYSDPKKEAERQAKIRSLRIQALGQTKQMLGQEQALRQAQISEVQAAIRREGETKVEGLKREEVQVQRIVDLHEQLSKANDYYNRVLQSRQALHSSFADYAEGQFGIAAKLETNEGRRQKIEEQAARARLEFLNEEQRLERISLENEISKNKLMLDREKIQLRLEEVQSRIMVQEKETALAVIKADPKSKKIDIQRAEGELTIAKSKDEGIAFKRQSIEAEEKLLNQDSDFKRRSLGLKQGLTRDNAEVDLAQLTKTKADDKALQQRALGRANQGLQDFRQELKNNDLDQTKPPLTDRFNGVQLAGGYGSEAALRDRSKAIVGLLPGNPKPSDPKIDPKAPAGTTRAIEKMHSDFMKGLGTMNSLLDKPATQIEMKYQNQQIFQGGDAQRGRFGKQAEETNFDSLNRVLEKAKTLQRGTKS